MWLGGKASLLPHWDLSHCPGALLFSGSRACFVGLVRSLAHIHTGVREAYSHWFVASGGQCFPGWAADRLIQIAFCAGAMTSQVNFLAIM